MHTRKMLMLEVFSYSTYI